MCKHENTIYVRNQDGHYCVQCTDCREIIKSDKHDGKLFIKHSDIPFGNPIFEPLKQEVKA